MKYSSQGFISFEFLWAIKGLDLDTVSPNLE